MDWGSEALMVLTQTSPLSLSLSHEGREDVTQRSSAFCEVLGEGKMVLFVPSPLRGEG